MLESEYVRHAGSAYEWVNAAAIAMLLQVLGVGGNLGYLPFPAWLYWVGFVAYMVCAVFGALAVARILDMKPAFLFAVAVFSGLAVCVGPFAMTVVVAGWLTIVLFRHGVRLGLGNWTCMDYKKRAAELQAMGK